MTRLWKDARRWCLIGLMSWPLLAQTQGCLGGASSSEARQNMASGVAGVVSAATNYLIRDAVNRLLDVPTSSFGGFSF